jgi:hypothetical protein
MRTGWAATQGCAETYQDLSYVPVVSALAVIRQALRNLFGSISALAIMRSLKTLWKIEGSNCVYRYQSAESRFK